MDASYIPDPIERLLEENEGHSLDNFLIHLCSWSDVVKNDLRKALGKDNQTINRTLTRLLDGAIDVMGRYQYQAKPSEAAAGTTYSAQYVQIQCLLSEWLCVYRAISVYLETNGALIVDD